MTRYLLAVLLLVGCDNSHDPCARPLFIPNEWPPNTWEHACPTGRHVEVLAEPDLFKAMAACVCQHDGGAR